jgi:Na+-transporting NADH:ubiquinone oxidoreductase subunit NqrE
MDMSSLNQSTEGTNQQNNLFFITIQEMIEVKKPSLRIFVSLIVYYPLLVIACATMVGVLYEQKMPNDQALKLPMFFAH